MPTIYLFSKKTKQQTITIFHLKVIISTAVKNRLTLHAHVIVMHKLLVFGIVLRKLYTCFIMFFLKKNTKDTTHFNYSGKISAIFVS